MINNEIFNSIKIFFKNPVHFFGIILLFFSFIILFNCDFKIPDFYIDRALAHDIAQTVPSRQVDEAVKHLLNPNYYIHNLLFIIWGYCVAVFVFVLTFRIKNFDAFKKLSFFNNKWFVYIWINLSYFIWVHFFVSVYMNDLDKYVYNSYSDTMGIPYFILLSMFTFIGFIYYPVINLLSFITYNTKIKPVFYLIFWIILLFFVIFIAYETIFLKFTYWHLILDFIYVIWLAFIVYSIGYKK